MHSRAKLDYTSEQAEKLIMEYLEAKSASGCDLLTTYKDPIKDALLISKEIPSNKPVQKEGLAVIFHGAPRTSSVFAANKLGKRYDLSILNIDELILDSLAENSVESTGIMEIINSTYAALFDPSLELDLPQDPSKDQKELIRKRINDILNKPAGSSVRKKGKKGKTDRSSSSKKSSARSASSKKPVSETLFSIPLELLITVLKHQLLKYPKGFVIESLNSLFIPSSVSVLNSLLQAMGNTKYIQGVLLYNSLDHFLKHKEQRDAERAKAVEEERNEKLSYFEEMPGDEFVNLSEEDKKLYKEVYIAERKQKSEQRLKALR